MTDLGLTQSEGGKDSAPGPSSFRGRTERIALMGRKGMSDRRQKGEVEKCVRHWLIVVCRYECLAWKGKAICVIWQDMH